MGTEKSKSDSFERDRTPYSFSQNDIQIGVSQPTKTSLYPNLGTTASAPPPTYNHTYSPNGPTTASAAPPSYNYTYSTNGPVNNSPFNNLQNTVKHNFERDRTPYSFSQNDIQIGVSQPTKTSLSPNLGTTASAAPPNYNQTYSPNGPVNNSPFNNLQNTVKHNFERDRTPYSFSQNDIQIGVSQPTKTSLSPNLGTTASAAPPNYNQTYSPNGPVNNSPFNNLQNTVKHNFERDRTPYSFSQNDIQIGVSQPTKTSLSPNLGTTASAAPPNYNQTYSPNGPVNNSPLNNLQNTVKHNFERDRTPYSFSQNDIQIGVSQPTKTSLSPNLGTTASAAPPNYNQTYSPNGPVNNSPFNNLQNTVKHNSPTAPPAPAPPRPAPPRPAPSAAPTAVPRQRFRDRSTSRPRSQNRSDSNDELNCPTCHQKYTINIYQCNSGHSSCSNCKDRCMCCGICGYPISDVRNRSLESYIAERKVSCPNSQDGCQLFIKMAELEAHEKECPFKEMMCPLAATFGQCRWRGKLPQLSKHFEEAHPIHCTGEVNKELTVTQTQQHIVYLVVIGSFNFLFNLKVSESDRKVYLTVQLIGTKHSAEKWSYEIHVYNKSQPRRKYQYTDICHSNSTSLDEIFSTEECATLPFAYADTFVNRNLLTYKFFIKKDVESRPRNEEQGGVRRRRYGKSYYKTSN